MKNTQAGDAQTELQIIRCYVYARVARSNPLAIERQVHDCQALAERLSTQDTEYQIVRVFQDDGGSGVSNRRPAYEEMLAELSRGEASTVLVFDEERLYRDLTLHKAYSEMSHRLGVATYSVRSGRIGR